MIWIVITVLVIGCFFLIVRNRSKRERGAPKKVLSPEEQLKQLQPGAVLRLKNVGMEIVDEDLVVQKRHLYKQGGFSWVELECESGAGKVLLEIEQDDELYISVSLKELDFEDIGIEPSDLEKMAKKQKGKIEYNGTKFKFDESGDAKYLRDSQGDGAPFRYYDFESDDEEYFISIERWGEGSYDIWYGEYVDIHQISIYSTEGN